MDDLLAQVVTAIANTHREAAMYYPRTGHDVSFRFNLNEYSELPAQHVRVSATVSPSYFDGWDVENLKVIDETGEDVTDDLLSSDFNNICVAALDYRHGEEEDAMDMRAEMRREWDDD